MGNHISMSQGTSKWFKTIKKVLCGLFFCKICCPYLDIRGTHEYEDYLKECEGEKQMPEEELEFHYSKDPKK